VNKAVRIGNTGEKGVGNEIRNLSFGLKTIGLVGRWEREHFMGVA